MKADCVPDLTIVAARGLTDVRARALTQAIASHLYAQTPLSGIQFASRHGDDLTLWAVFESRRMVPNRTASRTPKLTNSPPTILTSNAPSTPWGCAGSPKQEPAIRNESGASPWPGIRDRHRTPAIGWVWAASSGGMRPLFCAILRNVNPVPLEEPGICAILRTFGAETGRILRRIAQKRPASKRTRSSVRTNRHITLRDCGAWRL